MVNGKEGTGKIGRVVFILRVQNKVSAERDIRLYIYMFQGTVTHHLPSNFQLISLLMPRLTHYLVAKFKSCFPEKGSRRIRDNF